MNQNSSITSATKHSVLNCYMALFLSPDSYYQISTTDSTGYQNIQASTCHLTYQNYCATPVTTWDFSYGSVP